MATLKPAINVSPLIRFSRWSLLLAGITYGITRQRTLTAKETVLREQARIEKERMAPILAAEKARLAKEQLDDLAKQAGVQL